MKTAEEIAKELYPDEACKNAIEIRKAFVKGYQRKCLEDMTSQFDESESERLMDVDAMTFIQDECQKEYGKGSILIDSISVEFAAELLERWSTTTKDKSK